MTTPMMIEPTLLNWFGFQGYKLENDAVRVIIVPEAGGRIVSLFDKVRQREWPVSPAQSHPVRKIEYGADFNSLTSGGWDEMFPTIIATSYPGPGKYHGSQLPDHGEAWTLPWEVHHDTSEELHLSYKGRNLPYEFHRWLALGRDGMLTFTYEIRNLGEDPLYFLWTAHPQFACHPDTRIELPEEVTAVTNVLPLEWGAEWGPAGTINPWPEIPARAEFPALRQDLVGTPTLNRGRKFYMMPDRPIGWARLVDDARNCRLHMSWDSKSLPYCGIWVDEGALNQVASVAIEPASAYYDDLTLAWKQQRLSSIPANGSQSWKFLVSLSDAH